MAGCDQHNAFKFVSASKAEQADAQIPRRQLAFMWGGNLAKLNGDIFRSCASRAQMASHLIWLILVALSRELLPSFATDYNWRSLRSY
jgi:hypothetical protein